MSQGVDTRLCLPKTAWPPTFKPQSKLNKMKTLVMLTLGAVVLYQVAKRYNINSVDSLKKAIKPHVNELMPKLKKMVPDLKKVLS